MRRARATLSLQVVAALCVLALLATACGNDDGGGGKTTEAPSSGGPVDLNALFFRQEPDGSASGGFSPVQVSVSESSDESFQVSFTEDEVAGTGDQWSAAGWEAATVATLISGGALTGRKVEFQVTGRIDGPSAGGAMTVGVLAAFRGDELDPNVVMTGTINPDGTIGPVGGIPQKVEGAAAIGEDSGSGDSGGDQGDGNDQQSMGVEPASLRPAGDSSNSSDSSDVVMLIPAGQTTAVDEETGESVNVADLAASQGVEVREVANIYEAYQEFTGEELPRPDDTGDTDLDPEATDRVEAAVTKWLARYDEAEAKFAALGPEAQSSLGSLFDDAATSADKARSLSDQGLAAGAYSAAVQAAALGSAAVTIGDSFQTLLTQGIDAFAAELGSGDAVVAESQALVDKLGGFQPESVSDASALIGAYTNAVDAVSLSLLGDDLLTRPADSQEQAVQDLVSAGVFFEFARTLIEAAEDELDFGRGMGGPAVDEDVDLTAVSDFFRKAAEANLNAFDTVVIQPEADAAGVSADVVKTAFLDQEFGYALSVQGLNVLSGLSDYFGDADTSAYAALGGALAAYSRTSALMAEYYSLGAQLDDNLQIVGVTNERALISALDLAEEQLAGAITTLRSEEVEPVGSVGAYETGRIDREGDVSDKFDGLQTLWAGYVGGRMLAYLGGFETAGLS